MEKKKAEVQFTAGELRVFRLQSLCATLLGIGLLGLHVYDSKIPGGEFFDNISGWRPPSNPVAYFAGVAGFFLTFFAPIFLGGSLMITPSDRPRSRLQEAFGVVLLLSGVAMLFTMVTSPTWFGTLLACICLPLALAMFAVPILRAWLAQLF